MAVFTAMLSGCGQPESAAVSECRESAAFAARELGTDEQDALETCVWNNGTSADFDQVKD